VQILQKPTFQRAYKKLHVQQQSDVDDAIRLLIQQPQAGEAKVGDLAGVRVYKFRTTNQLMLLAYSHDEDTITLTLLALGSHENFYRDLKKSL